MPGDAVAIAADRVTYAYGARPVVDQVSLTLRHGDRLALAGPNGSGKTTLLRLLSGSLRPRGGRILLDREDIRTMRPASLARRVAVVAQHIDPTIAFTVRDLVTMGRTPYLSLFGSLSRGDRAAVDRSLDEVDASRLASRHFSDLSGGEQQRVMVAMALAQETDFLLLDEPTVHLDLQHQHELLELLNRLQRERGIGLLAVMHDLNLSALYFDLMAVLSDGSVVANGAPEEVLTRDDVLAVFQAPLSLISHPRTGAPQVLLDRSS